MSTYFLIVFTIYIAYCYFQIFFLYKISWEKMTVNLETNRSNFISVIIASRNEGNNLLKLIDDIRVQDFPKNKYELIIVDDHSNIKNLEILKQYIFISHYYQ